MQKSTIAIILGVVGTVLSAKALYKAYSLEHKLSNTENNDNDCEYNFEEDDDDIDVSPVKSVFTKDAEPIKTENINNKD